MPVLPALLIVAAFIPLTAYAAEGDGATYTSPDAADDDFSFQGEFLGWQRPTGSHRSTQRIGLQVVALGDQNFLAVKYLGGLPGDGWQQDGRFLLKGRRVGHRLDCEGDVYDLVVTRSGAHVLSHDGSAVGHLERIHRVSPTLGAPPPAGAFVLFDGSGVYHFKTGRLTSEGWLAAGTETRDAWNDFRLHGEFLLPYQPHARGQARANSGFYLQSRYEVQVLDSFGLEGVENECAALYKVRRPDLNMCLPPLVWQTYDIDFTAARFDDAGHKISPMRITVWHNGVPVHTDAAIPARTGSGQPEGPQPLPLKLQDHGNPVAYRNLWIIDTSQPAARSTDWLRLPLKAEPVPVGVGGIEPAFAL
jgi:hypothetical protein